jgi:hypothetical protein
MNLVQPHFCWMHQLPGVCIEAGWRQTHSASGFAFWNSSKESTRHPFLVRKLSV